MARRYMLALCLSSLMALPASLASACHLERISLELSCTQYKLQVAAVGVSHSHAIRYSFAVTPTTGGAPVTVSKTIPVNAPSGNFTEIVTNPITLVGSFDAKSFSGSATLLSESGNPEGTQEIKLSPAVLNCSTPQPGS